MFFFSNQFFSGDSFSLLIRLVINHDTTFDLKTDNNLPSAKRKKSIDHISITTKRLHVGSLIGYSGPISVNSAMIAIRNAINVVSKGKKEEIRKWKQRTRMMNSQIGKCIGKVQGDYDVKINHLHKKFNHDKLQCVEHDHEEK